MRQLELAVVIHAQAIDQEVAFLEADVVLGVGHGRMRPVAHPIPVLGGIELVGEQALVEILGPDREDVLLGETVVELDIGRIVHIAVFQGGEFGYRIEIVLVVKVEGVVETQMRLVVDFIIQGGSGRAVIVTVLSGFGIIPFPVVERAAKLQRKAGTEIVTEGLVHIEVSPAVNRGAFHYIPDRILAVQPIGIDEFVRSVGRAAEPASVKAQSGPVTLLVVRTVTPVQVEAPRLVGFLGDDVDHAAHRIGTVQGRTGTPHDFHPFHIVHIKTLVVDIVHAFPGHFLPVDQEEDVAPAHALHVHDHLAVHLPAELHAGNLGLQHVGYRQRACLLYFPFRDDRRDHGNVLEHLRRPGSGKATAVSL